MTDHVLISRAMMHHLLEDIDALLSNEEHATSGGMRSYQIGSPTWELWEAVKAQRDKLHAILAAPCEPATRPHPLTIDEIVNIGNEVHIAMPDDSDEQEELVAIARAIIATQSQPLTVEQFDFLVSDLAEWSSYVEVDNAPITLTEHVKNVLYSNNIRGKE